MKKGFTLIELLVVVVIIAILAAIALPQYQVAVAKSRLATLKNAAHSIATAQELYFLTNGSYASTFTELSFQLSSSGTLNNTKTGIIYPWGTCSFSLASGGIVGCSNSKVSYQMYLNHSQAPYRLNCQVTDNTDTVAVKVCKSDTGQESPSWTNGLQDSYTYRDGSH